MNKKIVDKTIKSLEHSLEKHPDNVKLMTNLAEVYLKNDILGPKTLRLLEKLSDITPENVRVHRALSICYLIHQTTELVNNIETMDEVQPSALKQTRERLEALISQHGQSADLHKSLGDIALFLGAPDQAIDYYSDADSLGYNNYSHIIKVFELTQSVCEHTLETLKYFARVADKSGRTILAADLYRDILDQFSDEPVAGKWLTSYLEKIVAEEEELDLPPDHKLELIDIYIKTERIEDALKLMHSLNISEIKDYGIVKRLARILIDMEDYRQAFDFLSRIPLDAENKALINEITLRLERLGELDTAVYLLQFINTHDLVIMEARERENQELKIHTELGLAELNYRNKKWDSALEKYISILKMGYDDPESLLPRVYDIISNMEKPPLSVLFYLSDYYLQEGNLTKADQYMSTALEHYPGHGETQQRLRVIFDRKLSRTPQTPNLRIRSGDLYLKTGKVERAISEFKKAAEFSEYSSKTARRLAKAYETAGEYSMAMEQYQALDDVDRSDFEDLFRIHEHLVEHGLLRDAIQALRIVQNVDPNMGDLASRIEELESQYEEKGESMYVDPKMRELIGEHAIGRYKYMSKIGSGGMGVVHKVFDIKNNTIVAMKILREGLSSSSKAIDRFFREARIAATLDHKNIVRIYDYNISNVFGQSYITMSFVDGESLRDIIERRFAESLDINANEIAQSLYYISQLCEALDCTHEKGIIHRDIKPDNIMIDSGDVVKITDFGIVHIEEATFTPTGALIGTPRYMSPEQVRGGAIDGRSDIYSAGIIMYELLVGSPPFISGDIAYQQVNVEPTPPRDICPNISEEVNTIIMKCLEKSPADRYPESLEMKKKVDEALKDIGGYTPKEIPPGEIKKQRKPRSVTESDLDMITE